MTCESIPLRSSDFRRDLFGYFITSHRSKIPKDVMAKEIEDMLLHSLKVRRRKFLETVELQVALKNYDPQRDRRFAGTVR